jgi:exosortase/archaeosortase family protein
MGPLLLESTRLGELDLSKLRPLPPLLASISRAELFGGLFVLGCANGLAGRIGQSITDHDGWVVAILSTFKISVIIFAACFIGVSLVFRGAFEDGVWPRKDKARIVDFVIVGVFLILVLLPIAPLSWLAVTILSIYILFFTNDTRGIGHRGALVLLATTVPMLWSPLMFDFFARIIVRIEASLVGWLLGTHSSGNIVEFANHSANLQISPGCSALANVSLALLCWITLSQSVGHKWRPQDFLWCLLTCGSLIAVNVIRISVMGLDLSYYYAIHNVVGDTITNAIIFGLTVGISVLGFRREIFSRA